MMDDQAALSRFAGNARLFPLPNLVVFPQTLQGLHIFEPRYRQMTADALAGDQLICMVLISPEADIEYDDEPDLAPVGCLGRITQHQELPDGRYNFRLRGLHRVRLVEELNTDKLYRSARVELMPDVAPAEMDRLVSLRRQLADAVLARFDPDGPATQHLRDLFASDTPLGPLCDALAYSLPLELSLKQDLLADAQVANRVGVLIRSLDVPKPDTSRPFPPEFSDN